MNIVTLSGISPNKQALFVSWLLAPLSLFGGWSQEATGGRQGDDIPATAESPKLYYEGTEALPFDTTELPVMYPESKLWFDVRDKNLVLQAYIREVVNNRYLNLHTWETAQDYFSADPSSGKLDKDYLKALHARMAFFSKLLQMPYKVAGDESHNKANTSIIWADYNDMVNTGSLQQSSGEGISYPGWVKEQDQLNFWESHYPNMQTHLISGPGAELSPSSASDFVNQYDLPIDPTDFLVLAPQQTRSIAHDLSLLRPMVWSLSNSRDVTRAHSNYGALPQDIAQTPVKPLAYYANKSYPFVGHTPSTWTPDTWYFATGWASSNRPQIADEETGEWTHFWEPTIVGMLSSSHLELLDGNGDRVDLLVQGIGNMLAFTALNEQGDPVNLGRGIANGQVRSFTVRGNLMLKVRWSKVGEEDYHANVPYDLQYDVHLVGTEQMDFVVWPDEVQIAYDLKYNPRWGYYYTEHYPWIWRYKTRGWLYMADNFVREDDQKHFFYSYTDQAWLFISAMTAPHAYDFNKGVWNTD